MFLLSPQVREGRCRSSVVNDVRKSFIMLPQELHVPTIHARIHSTHLQEQLDVPQLVEIKVSLFLHRRHGNDQLISFLTRNERRRKISARNATPQPTQKHG